ncbi:TonB-dependent receptor [Marivirga sp.]|uniref:TonB-dependent receptor n=1 Tax=Marivirga sp. TaxID=2018662 RepID=UPI003DA715D7
MRHLITLFLFLFSSILYGQTLITGTITDKSREALPGVSIYIEGTYEGTSTIADGSFQFSTKIEGEKNLVFQSIGYKKEALTINLEGMPLNFQLALKEAIDQMKAVTITAGAMEASDERKAVVLRPIDIVTTPSAIGDIVGAFQTLPGTSTVGNDGRLFVRGGDASETAIFIDGLKVSNAFGTTANNVPSRTRFSPNMFKGTFFSTGGYSAEYGQALSSALVLNSIDMPVRSQADISLMSLGGGVSQTLVGKRNSITANANFFDLGPYQQLIEQDFDWERAPHSWDVSLLGRQKWGNSGMLKAFFQKESSGMELWQAQPGSSDRGQLIKINNDYNVGQVSFKQAAKNDWSFTGGLGYTQNNDLFNIDGLEVEQSTQLFHAKGVAIKDFSDAFSTKFGVETYWNQYEETLLQEDLSRSFEDPQANLFIESDYYLNNDLVLRAGLRSGHSQLINKQWLDPRASLSYKFKHEGQLSLAYGQFSQLPESKFRVLNNNLGNTEASHYILNYFIAKNNRTFRAEAFHKEYNNLLTYDGNNLNPVNLQVNGDGYATGMDFFYRDRESVKNTDFWITYSFVDSKRQFNHFQTEVQPNYAPRHNGSVVIKHIVSAINSQIGGSFSFNDGYVYTNPNMVGEQNSKTKSFQSLSLSWSYLPKPNLIIHFACNNVLERDNKFGYQYANQANEEGIFASSPIIQGAPRFLFLGVFLTLSTDKNANQLNNL